MSGEDGLRELFGDERGRPRLGRAAARPATTTATTLLTRGRCFNNRLRIPGGIFIG